MAADAGKGEASRLVALRVTPKARHQGISEEIAPDGSVRYRIQVTAPAEGGKANAAVIAVLAKHLGLAKSRITLVRGDSGRDKLVRIETE